MKKVREKLRSWDYQKNRYTQINLKFFKEDLRDMELVAYVKSQDNASMFIKDLIWDSMMREVYDGILE